MWEHIDLQIDGGMISLLKIRRIYSGFSEESV
jgi:hypothetical protein